MQYVNKCSCIWHKKMIMSEFNDPLSLICCWKLFLGCKEHVHTGTESRALVIVLDFFKDCKIIHFHVRLIFDVESVLIK